MTSAAVHIFFASLILLAPMAATAGSNPRLPFAPTLFGYATGQTTPMQSLIHAQPLAIENVLHTFSGPPDGAAVYAGLLPGKHGEFFGTTLGGGVTTPSGCCGGVVYEISASGQESILYNFRGGEDGQQSQASLIADSSGNLYGVTTAGGGSLNCFLGCGTVFELQAVGSSYTERVLHAFQGGLDGQGPDAGLTMGANGVIYGTTIEGGSGTCPGSGFSGCGTVFSLTPSGSTYTENSVYSFQGGADGAFPEANMIADAKGNLYGTTQFGGTENAGCPATPFGTNSCGTVFKVSKTGKERVIYRFLGGADGASPRSGLLAVGGSLFGLTLFGGGSGGANPGIAFELTPSGNGYTERLIYVFGTHGSGDALRPFDAEGLVADQAGNLYGTASEGGQPPCSCGAVFELSPAHSHYREKVLYSFTKAPDGNAPRAGVVLVGTHLYGTTFGGGANCYGSSFECGTVYKVKL